MSSSHTYLSALAITGSLLSGGSVLMGSSLVNPGMNQDTVIQAAAPSSLAFNAYSLASSGDHDRQNAREQQNKESAQEDNAGADDSQPAVVPTTWVKPVIVEKDQKH